MFNYLLLPRIDILLFPLQASIFTEKVAQLDNSAEAASVVI